MLTVKVLTIKIYKSGMGKTRKNLRVWIGIDSINIKS